ncbi:hypothetical protein GLA29479_614 [Lysobacter antibioticus]|uniref:hypothetical protein n=1 Tax=Lysobacter antibioticus TaxID=84531 RepID=UPI0007173F01|nr:hypothetical protein [Lysobacter antibioticus]ALN61499.1 hypothetical protein GLA29479_614 [Lysobacter antibioticus]
MTTTGHFVLEGLIQEGFRSLTRKKIDPWLNFRQGIQIIRADGTEIGYEGIEFEGSPRDVYWDTSFIDPFLRNAAEIWIQTAAKTAREQQHDVMIVLEFVQGVLISESRRVLVRMVDVDQRLRGKGFPASVSADWTRAEAKLVALTDYVQALMNAELSQETFNARAILIQSAEKGASLFDTYSTWLTASYAAFAALIVTNKDKVPLFVTPSIITGVLVVLAVMVLLGLKQKWNAVTVAARASGETIGRSIAETGPSQYSLSVLAKAALQGSIWPMRHRVRKQIERAQSGDVMSDAQSTLRAAQWQAVYAFIQTLLVVGVITWIAISSVTHRPMPPTSPPAQSAPQATAKAASAPPVPAQKSQPLP